MSSRKPKRVTAQRWLKTVHPSEFSNKLLFVTADGKFKIIAYKLVFSRFGKCLYHIIVHREEKNLQLQIVIEQMLTGMQVNDLFFNV